MLIFLSILIDTPIFICQLCVLILLAVGFMRIFYFTSKQETQKFLNLLKKRFMLVPFYPESSIFQVQKGGNEVAFDIPLPEPYKWLEKKSEKRSIWLSEQNALFTNYMEQLNFTRSQLKSRLRKFLKCEAFETPLQVNNSQYFYFKKYRKDQEHFILFTTGNVRHKGSVLLDPNVEFYQQNVTVLGTWISDDSSLLSYVYIVHSKGGRNLMIKVRDVLSRRDNPYDIISILLDEDEDVSSFSLSWLHGCQGFFYSRRIEKISAEYSQKYGEFLEGSSREEMQMQTQMQGVYFHRIGSAEDNDFIVFKCNPERDLDGDLLSSDCPIISVSHDDSYLCISLFEEHDSFSQCPNSKRGNKVVILDISDFNHIDCNGLGLHNLIVDDYSNRYLTLTIPKSFTFQASYDCNKCEDRIWVSA